MRHVETGGEEGEDGQTFNRRIALCLRAGGPRSRPNDEASLQNNQRASAALRSRHWLPSWFGRRSHIEKHGVFIAEEDADGINIVQVEHRPPWEKMVFMMKNGSMQLVGVPNEEMAATLSTQGYKRVTVAFYSTGADLPGGSADKSGAAEEEDDNDMQLAPVVVTIPNALPGIKAGANDPSAAEQVVEQLEVSCNQCCICCSTCLDLYKSDHLFFLVRLWVPSAKSRV